MKIVIILIFMLTVGCSQNNKEVKWNDPGFTVVRAIITNGMSLGK